MLQAELKKAGFTNVINVAEGMVGGPHGQGWIKTGLPIRPGTGPRVRQPSRRPP